MQTSLLLAKLIGPILIVMGLTALYDLKSLKDMAEEFMTSRALIFFAGFLALLGGLAIINTHNVWTGWPVVITIFGWIMLIGGIIRIAFPALTKSIGERMLANDTLLRVLAAAQALLGAFFVYVGYF